MKKIKFLGFSEGSEVVISAAQNGVKHGPLTVSAWKQQPQPMGRPITFDVYSLHGSGAEGPLGGRAISDGDLIEMVAPGNLSLYVDNVQGAVTTDMRRLTVMTDYGERYDAQYLEHSHLPAGFTTPDPTGPTLGLYPGFFSGHVHRGTDMNGNQVLTRDYPGDRGPVGTVDRTVTVTVSDDTGASGVLTFTVRLIEATRYYGNRNGTVYGTPAGMGPDVQADIGWRRGTIFISRTDHFVSRLGDFDTLPLGSHPGDDIFYMHLPDGVLSDSLFRQGGEQAAKIYEASTGSPVEIADFNWVNAEPRSFGIYLRGGETFEFNGEVSLFGDANSQMGSWGTGAAKITGASRQRYNPNPLNMLKDVTNEYQGYRFSNIHFEASTYDVSDETWRLWWNIIPYTNKSGSFITNTNQELQGSDYNGEIVTNDRGSFAQIIGDNGTKLLLRRIVDSQNINSKSANLLPFSDGDTIRGLASGATCSFTEDGSSRQDRSVLTPPAIMEFSASGNTPGALVFDGCEFSGAHMCISNVRPWSLISDTLMRDYWDYAILSDNMKCVVENALVVAQPSHYEGGVRFFGNRALVANNRRTFSATRKTTGETGVPVANEVTHSGQRYGYQTALAMYKVGHYTYGGHGNSHQPSLRMGTNGSPGDLQQYVYQHGCFFSGGLNTMQITTLQRTDTVPRTPKAWVMDQCWIRGAYCSVGYLASQVTNMGIKNCRIGHPEDVTMEQNNRDITFIQFVDSSADDPHDSSPDVNAVPSFVENCIFEFRATGNPGGQILSYDKEIRGIPIQYDGNSIEVDGSKVASVAAFP